MTDGAPRDEPEGVVLAEDVVRRVPEAVGADVLLDPRRLARPVEVPAERRRLEEATLVREGVLAVARAGHEDPALAELGHPAVGNSSELTRSRLAIARTEDAQTSARCFGSIACKRQRIRLKGGFAERYRLLKMTVPAVQQKSPLFAAFLGFLLGPFGILYVSWKQALLGLLVVLFLIATGIGAALIPFVYGFWGWMAASRFNENLERDGQAAAEHEAARMVLTGGTPSAFAASQPVPLPQPNAFAAANPAPFAPANSSYAPNPQTPQWPPAAAAGASPVAPAASDAAVAAYCDQCGAALRPASKFCGACGASRAT